MTKWFVALWLDEDSGEVVNSEVRGVFETDDAREEAVEELEGDCKVVLLELEGDDDAVLEIAD